jgi:hypothetical protein
MDLQSHLEAEEAAREAAESRLRTIPYPMWEPSWIATGKDFFSTEDGQPNLLYHGRDTPTRWQARHAEKDLPPTKDHMN